MKQDLATSSKVMTALAVLEGGDDPAALFRFGPEGLTETLQKYAGVLKARFARGNQQELAEMLRSWSERSPALPIHQIHPGWVLEIVRQESPRVIGMICRYLPGSHVRYLIENLPRELRDRLPTLNESFGLPASLMEQVKQYLAHKFFHASPPNADERFSCRHIPWMNGKDIYRIVRELGYAEIRDAFAGVDIQALQVFLTRFPIDEARKIRKRLDQGPLVPLPQRKRAQEHIVGLNLDVSRAEDLPFEIGLSVLARCVSREDPSWIEGVVVRLSPTEGYSLRRAVKEAFSSYNPEAVALRQTELLGLIRQLAEQRQIQQYWQSHMEDEETDSEKSSLPEDMV